ncbi:MAG TPA: hypothetical protein VMC04_00475 [Verrucomicrobiae bacterium]|jgi:hypothetical protein|nr:hypothetical protein [Verrucomicrobiae bacterium]
MTASAPSDAAAACLTVLEAALDAATLPALPPARAADLDEALRALARRHGAAAVPLLERLGAAAPGKEERRAARRALYRLEQSGQRPARAAGASPVRPVVAREAEHPVRAWLSGIDGSGSRAAWILFEGGLGGGLRLCSLILNDEAGIMDAAGGPIARKRLEAELRGLRESQKLPWVEVDGGRACALVAQALALHERLGTVPPPEFARWRKAFSTATVSSLSASSSAGAQRWPPHSPSGGLPSGDQSLVSAVDPAALERSASLLELPELGGWFLDPARVASEALALLQARESRLVVSDQIKAEREAAILDGVIEAHFPTAARRRWAGRLREMADIFAMTGRDEAATLARQTAGALADAGRAAAAVPFVRALAARGLEMAAEVALGRARLDEVSRAPARRARS